MCITTNQRSVPVGRPGAFIRAEDSNLERNVAAGSEQDRLIAPDNYIENRDIASPNQVPKQFRPYPMRFTDKEDTRKANCVHQKSKDSKFSGDLSHFIGLTLRDYIVCTRQHKLSNTKKADFFVKILEGPALTFVFQNAQDEINFEARSSLRLGERYHHPLRQTYGKIMSDYPSFDPKLLLALAVKVTNDTLGPEVLFPSDLVFNKFLPVYMKTATSKQRPTFGER